MTTIGVPVFNGELYIAQALDSIVQQTCPPLEVIIQDNASTDATEEICRGYAANNEHIHYFRSATNIGAAQNFNSILSRAKGKYFKWNAHDDRIHPEFLERCQPVLDQDQSAVLVSSTIQFIDENGNTKGLYESPFRTVSSDPRIRFTETLYGHRCFEIWGLMRTEALKRSGLIRIYNHGDGVLLSELALAGRFALLEQPLISVRLHERQSMHVYGVTKPNEGPDFDAYTAWFSGRTARRRPKSHSDRFIDYLRMIRRADIGSDEKILCTGFGPNMGTGAIGGQSVASGNERYFQVKTGQRSPSIRAETQCRTTTSSPMVSRSRGQSGR